MPAQADVKIASAELCVQSQNLGIKLSA